MKFKRILAMVLCVVMVFGVVQPAVSAAPTWDNPPANTPQNTDSSLIDIELTTFKGGRNEYMEVPLEEPIVADKYDYEMNVDMKQFATDKKCFFVKPVAYDENSTFVINGTPTDFNVPVRVDVPVVVAGAADEEVPCIIEVTSGDGSSTSTYTLNFVSQNLLDKIKVSVIQENLPDNGVYHLTSIGGFTTSEDGYLFVGEDRAILFDAFNGGAVGTRRGGDAKKEIYNILTSKFNVTDPDNFPIDVVVTHLSGDHLGMLNPNVGPESQLSGRGVGNGTVYWPLRDATNLSRSLYDDPDTDIKMIEGGYEIVGPDFGNGPLKFECILVPGHTNGHLVYLYDSKTDGQCDESYLMTGDAIGSGSYVFTFGNGKPLVETFSRSMEKLWNRVKEFDNLHILCGHSWQERVHPDGETALSYVEDMYIASKMALKDVEAGEFTTTSATAYVRKLAYGTAGYWYNDFGIIDYSTGDKIQIDPANLLALILVNEVPKENLLANYNPVTTAFNVTVPDAAPLYLSADAFGEDATMEVTLNGDTIDASTNAALPGDSYKLEVLASDNAALTNGINVVKVQVTDAASSTSKTYTINIRTISDNSLYPLPDISAEVYALPGMRPLNVPQGESTINDIKISSFKGGRLEPYNIELDEDVDVFTWSKHDLTATMDWGNRTSKVVYIVAETTNPNAKYTINGDECEYPVPYRYEVQEGENKLTIVTEEGNNTSTYTLTINATPLWDDYVKEEIEPGLWRISDASGFVTNEDMFLFVGEDKATLFDTGMGEGDLRAYVDEIIGNPELPIEVVITHSNGDHYGKVEQFTDCKVYWPLHDSAGVPIGYDVSNYTYVKDGDTITGPKFDGTAITFECIEVTCHTPGSMIYLYDNLVQKKLNNSYIATGDAISSGSYVFNFGTNKAPVATFLKDMRKLEGKIAKFADGFYDADSDVKFDDVKGLYFLTGHPWQETASMQPIYSANWLAPSALQKLAGIQMVRDMRIAAEKVVNGEMQGKLYTRLSGRAVQELRQLQHRQAGLWYNGWDVIPAAASLDHLEVFSDVQNRGLVRPNFNAYTTSYTANVITGEVLKVTALPFEESAKITINGETVTAGSVIEIDTTDIDAIIVEVTEGNDVRTYTVDLTFSYAVTASAYQGGTVDELTVVKSGEDVEVTVKADEGSKLVAILIDGVTVNLEDVVDDVYTIKDVQNNVNVRALFVEDQEDDFAAKFTDVPSKDDQGNDMWYYGAVDMLTGLNIIQGTTATTFEPERDVTRAEFTKLVYELADVLGVEVEEDDDSPFTDWPVENFWAKGHIGWAFNNEIVKGYDATRFGPQDSIRRQDMSLIMQRFFEEYMGYDLPGDAEKDFADKAAIGEYAQDGVDYTVRTGLMQGDQNNMFGPLESALRNQVAQVFYNYLIYAD